MCLQVAFCNELLVALRADKWSLSRVSSHVGFEISGLRKLLQALLERADEDLFFFLGSLHFLYLSYSIRRISKINIRSYMKLTLIG